MTKRKGLKPSGAGRNNQAPFGSAGWFWARRGACTGRCSAPLVAAWAVAVYVILTILEPMWPDDPVPVSLCQDERGYVAHWNSDALDQNGQPLAEHDFDCVSSQAICRLEP